MTTATRRVHGQRGHNIASIIDGMLNPLQRGLARSDNTAVRTPGDDRLSHSASVWRLADADAIGGTADIPG